jgi:hypothetical protein
MIGAKRARLSLIEQLMLRCENASDAAANTATSFTPPPARLQTAQVGRQCAVGHAGLALDLREHLGRTGHLRHPFGRDETADFYIAQAGGAQGVDQLYLVGHADRLGFVLQTVARADFDQAYLGGRDMGLTCVIV